VVTLTSVSQTQQKDQLELALVGAAALEAISVEVAVMDLLPSESGRKTMNSAGSVLFMTTSAIDQDAVTASIRMPS
jgi:hypothetical protein